MTTTFVQRGTEIIKKAVDNDNAGNLDEALNLYLRGIEFLMTGKKYEQNPRVVAAIKEKINKYIERAEYIKSSLNNNNNNTKKNSTKKNSDNNNNNDNSDESKESIIDEETAKMQGGLQQTIMVKNPNVHWSDVAGLGAAKKVLQETVILPRSFPHLFTGKRKPLLGILLYGPPGTGKSYLAKALATEADNSTFFSVSSADLVSKFVGDSEKLVKNLFTMARAQKPSILFIDEIDSLASKRSDNEPESTRRLKTQFLVQMEGVGTDQRGVLTLGATNCPWDLDPAVRRRFGKRIYIPLPDKAARQVMFKVHIGDTVHSLTDNDFEMLAEKTEHFSGSDIAGVVLDALMEPVRTMQCATHFKKVSSNESMSSASNDNSNDSDEYVLVACSPNDPKAVQMTLMEIPKNEKDKTRADSLKLAHFLRILKNCKPSVGEEDIARQIEWTQKYGQEGS